MVQLSLKERVTRGPSESLETVKVLQVIHLTETISALVKRIHTILQTIEQWKIKYIPRGKNQVADHLIKIALERNLALQVFDKIHEELVVVVGFARVTNVGHVGLR